MKFVELSWKEFNSVCNSFDGSSFYQSYEWAKVKEYTGWKHYFVGVICNGRVVLASLILGKKIYLDKYLYYAPRGVLMDYNDRVLLEFFVREVKGFLMDRGGIVFKIDPLVELKSDDNLNVINNLIDMGFVHHGFTKGYNTGEIQMRWSYLLDITGDLAMMEKNMNHRCKRCIRKYGRYPLEVKYVDDPSSLRDFKDIMESTAKRQNHFDRTIDYYCNLNTILKDRSILLVIYLDRDRYLEECVGDKLYDLVKSDKRKMIPITSGVFIFDRDRLNYVYGGTYKEYMPLMAQYKMQMEMIKLAKEKGLGLYDFGGISGDFSPDSDNYGVYDFKRGFGGYVIEYIGEFDLVLNKFGYYIYEICYKLYRNTKKVIAKIKR